MTLAFNTVLFVTVRSFLITALNTFASLLFAPSKSPDRVMSPPTVAPPTIAAVAAFTSPVISTSAPAVISPEVFAVVNAAAHLLSACPKTFPFADGSMLLTINDCTFAPSELFDPITKLAFSVTSPSTFKS